MENTIVVILLASLLVLQAVGVYLLLIRRRFKMTNGEVDLEIFLDQLDQDVAQGRIGVEKNIQQLNKNIEEHKKENKELLNYIKENSEHTKEVVNSAISEFKDELNELLRHVKQDSDKSKEEIEKTVSGLKTALNTLLSIMQKDIESMKDEVGALRELTLEKEEKIKRYEEGYDQKNIKNFRQELFRILHFVEDKKNENDSEALIEVHEDLELLLEDVGIEKINIVVGQKYIGSEKVASIKNVEFVTDETKDGVIAKIVRNGFYIQVANGSEKVLRPAEIIVYKYDRSVEDEVNVKVKDVDAINQQEDKQNNEGK